MQTYPLFALMVPGTRMILRMSAVIFVSIAIPSASTRAMIYFLAAFAISSRTSGDGSS
ncbi:MAG: hypothetical protein WCB46_09245 [Methanoregula sp.]